MKNNIDSYLHVYDILCQKLKSTDLFLIDIRTNIELNKTYARISYNKSDDSNHLFQYSNYIWFRDENDNHYMFCVIPRNLKREFEECNSEETRRKIIVKLIFQMVRNHYDVLGVIGTLIKRNTTVESFLIETDLENQND